MKPFKGIIRGAIEDGGCIFGRVVFHTDHNPISETDAAMGWMAPGHRIRTSKVEFVQDYGGRFKMVETQNSFYVLLPY